mmetsp:Transcript_30365/g.97116  ORF Transcript_30365/g.97116 Transcript_30365/m.97116 type:complete len:221 (+) Transcript_30365:143-805(+)
MLPELLGLSEVVEIDPRDGRRRARGRGNVAGQVLLLHREPLVAFEKAGSSAAVFRLRRQELCHEGPGSRGEVRPAGPVELERGRHVGRREEGVVAPQHSEEDNPQGKEVQGKGGLGPLDDLRRDEAVGALHAVQGDGGLPRWHLHGKAEVGQLCQQRVAKLREEHVRGLHVPVDDALGVEKAKAGEELLGQPPHLALLHAAADLRVLRQVAGGREARQQD